MQDNNKVLLGESLAEFLAILIEVELGIKPSHAGVILCGDLYASLERRGGHGDVRNVWNLFNKNFKWVAGIAGNHDFFGNNKEFEEFKNTEGIFFIDKEIRDISGMKVAGISGIIGKADRINRVERNVYLLTLSKMLSKEPDILLLHQTPANYKDNIDGDEDIYKEIVKKSPNLTICGHYHWENIITELDNGTQVLNVDSRVVILINDSSIDNRLLKHFR